MSNKVKFLITYHKPAPLLNGNMYIPVNGGRANLQSKLLEGKISEIDYDWLLNNTVGDDSGDNISKDNDRYNEMSVIYWAWKNFEKLDNPDYIGLMHYRRHFIFNKWFLPKDSRWTVDYPVFNSNYLDLLNCSNEVIQNYLNKYDCLYAFYKADFSVYFHYKHSKYHNIEDLDYVLDAINQYYPQIYPSAKKYVNGFNHYFCNMFVLKKDLFNQYCEFVFDILSKYDQWRNVSELSETEKRFFISERITGIFIQYLIDKKVKCCPLNISFLINTNVKQEIRPAFNGNNIPVVFSTDDGYASYLCVLLTSLLENISEKNNYDIFVIYKTLSDINKLKIKKIFKNTNNISIRFIDVSPYLDNVDFGQFYLGIEHISISTYFRFLIADIFKNYKKIIYLDSDLIIKSDIAELYNQDIGNNWLGASLDIRESLSIKINETRRYDCHWKDYVTNTLGLDDPYKYFQAGVLIVNIEQFNKNNVKTKLFDKLRHLPKPFLQDQDILNSVCKGHVYYIPVSWNIEWQIGYEYPDYETLLPKFLCDLYVSALNNMNIIHYASPLKPWNEPGMNLASEWWQYARKTECYEDLLSNMLKYKAKHPELSFNKVVIEKKDSFMKVLIENIFSIKKSKDKSHKILSVLGVKFKFAKK